jgi:YVTN family beta-propeller protein
MEQSDRPRIEPWRNAARSGTENTMNKNLRRILTVLACGTAAALTGLPETARGRGEYLSPLAVAADRDGKTLYVAEATARQIAVVDLAAGNVVRTISLSDEPGGLALANDGMALYVVVGSVKGKVQAISLPKGKVAATFAVGHTPTAIAVSPDGKTLYVANRFNNNVSVVDVAARKETAKIPVLREPVATVLTPDGRFLFVANLLPEGRADADNVSAAVSVIDTAARRVIANIRLPNGSTSLRGLCVSPDGQYVYVTHTLARYQLPTTQLERGWMNTSALTILGVPGTNWVNTTLLDDVDLGAANPWGVACTADGKTLVVAHAGTHEVSVVDRLALHAKLDRLAKGEKVSEASVTSADVPNDLSFLVDLRRRIKLPGNGPRGLALATNLAYVAQYFSDTLAVVDLSPDARQAPRSIALGPEVKISIARKGEILFNDAGMCFQQWQSCVTCHPDARVDGLNWDLLNDGLGNPKNTRSMLLSHKTPPVMSHGVRGNAETAVRSGIKFIQFVVRPESDAQAIDEYLKSLAPVPSPYLVNGRLSPSAKRGKRVFEKAHCAACHPSPLFTDLKLYDVGTGKGMDKQSPFDTPTLVEVWRTAPYLYDGRSATMRDVITTDNPDDQHGQTKNLTEEERADLIEYILSQ